MSSETISSANREMLGLAHQDTGQKTKTITRLEVNTLVSLQRKAFLGFHALDEVDTLNYGRVSAMLAVPAPTSSCRFRKK